MTHADKVIALIEQHGLVGLCATDGCPCMDFNVHHCHIDVSCRKSAFGPKISVRSTCIDHDAEGLQQIMEAVKAAFVRDGLNYSSLEGYALEVEWK